MPNNIALTQETDQNYVLFKTQFIESLNMLSDARIIDNDPTTLQPCMVGIIVFGVIDPKSKVELKTSVFEKGFSKERNLVSWASCVAAPCTKECLDGHNKVRR